MNVIQVKTEELKPYEKNAKIHDKRQIDNVKESIKQFGFVQPIVIDDKNEIVIGHCRYEASKKLKLKEVPCVRVDELSDEQVKKLRLLDNKLNESEWDNEKIAEEIENLDFFGFDIDWGLNSDEIDDALNPYSMKTNIPQYEITGENPEIFELYEDEKSEQLIETIENSDVDEEIKEFLKLAAYRHLKFDYRKIAEYYVHASKEVQELMEQSALVIIDYDNAVANGFIKYHELIEGMFSDD